MSAPGRQTTPESKCGHQDSRSALRASEEQIQACIIQGLELLGYLVLATPHRYKLQTCPRCAQRFRPTGGYGSSRGVPDILISHRTWPAGCWLGLEVKAGRTAVSIEQQQLADAGRIILVRSWEEACAAVQAAHARYRT
jgi:hypothetical protein